MKRHLTIVGVYVVLIIIGIPWYWDKNSTLLIAGLPAWFVIAIVVSVCTSIFTAYLLLRFPWNTDTGSDED